MRSVHAHDGAPQHLPHGSPGQDGNADAGEAPHLCQVLCARGSGCVLAPHYRACACSVGAHRGRGTARSPLVRTQLDGSRRSTWTRGLYARCTRVAGDSTSFAATWGRSVPLVAWCARSYGVRPRDHPPQGNRCVCVVKPRRYSGV